MVSAAVDQSLPGQVVPRWQLPLLDHPVPGTGEGNDAAAEPSLAEQQASRIEELEATLAHLQSGIEAATHAAAAEGRASGYDDGRDAGRAAAAADYARECAARSAAWKTLEAALQQRLASLDASLDASIHDFVLELGSIVLRAELAISGAPLQRLIDEALAGLREDFRDATLLLHPDDLQLLHPRSLDARADPSLQRGELRLRTATGEIEASLPARIEAALHQLRRSDP